MKKLLALLTAVMLMMSGLTTVLAAPKPDNGLGGASKHLQDKFGLSNASDHFKMVKVESDSLGYKHVKLQQVVNGIPVYGGEYIVHFNKGGDIYSDSGKFLEKAKGFKAKGQYITKEAAIDAAKEDIGFAGKTAGSGSKYQDDEITADFYLYKLDEEFIPIYLVSINWLHEYSYGDWRVFVNAYDGKIVRKYDSIAYGRPPKNPTTPVVGTGTGVLGDTKQINLILNSGIYSLQDTTKSMAGTIITYTAANRTRLPGSIMTDTDAVWNSSVQEAGVDAHFYAGVVYDYYKNKFGRNSIDGSGMSIKSTVHYGVRFVNAFWNGKQMVYGDGDGVEAVELSGSLDIIAHEMTHGVNSYEANLEYADQSGALSESFSDVFGTAIEFYGQPQKSDWLIGEDVWTPRVNGDALRSMEDPTIYGDPDHMSKYVYTTADNGGVHTNSGIPNKAAYLIGSKIGVEKMAEMYYRTLTLYLTRTSDFSDARAALLQSAIDLYGSGSTEYNAVASAFDAVGIY